MTHLTFTIFATLLPQRWRTLLAKSQIPSFVGHLERENHPRRRKLRVLLCLDAGLPKSRVRIGFNRWCCWLTRMFSFRTRHFGCAREGVFLSAGDKKSTHTMQNHTAAPAGAASVEKGTHGQGAVSAKPNETDSFGSWVDLESAVARSIALMELMSEQLQRYIREEEWTPEDRQHCAKSQSAGIWELRDYVSLSLWRAYDACWEHQFKTKEIKNP